MTTELQRPEGKAARKARLQAPTELHADLLPTQGRALQAWALEWPEEDAEEPRAEEAREESPSGQGPSKKITTLLALLTAFLAGVVLFLGTHLRDSGSASVPAPPSPAQPGLQYVTHDQDLQFLARLSQIPNLEIVDPVQSIREGHLRCQELQDGWSYSDVQAAPTGGNLTREQRHQMFHVAVQTYCPQYLPPPRRGAPPK